jgi:hypothetical protein
MPRLSHTGWKLLCVAIRQTWGWVDPTSPTGRKQSDQISYSQFKDKTGIKSDTTISKALKECLLLGYLGRTEIGKARTGRPEFAYWLNTDYELNTPENGVLNTSENGVLNTPESEETKNKGKTTNDVVVALVDFGVLEDQARQYEQYPLDIVCGWIEYAKKQTLSNPPGFVLSMLKSGDLPPWRERKKAMGMHTCTICHRLRWDVIDGVCDECAV